MPNIVGKGDSFLAREKPAFEITGVWVNPNPCSLLAKVTVAIHRWGQTLVDCSVVRTNVGGYFVFPPLAPMVGRDGTVIKGPDGKSKHRPWVIWSKESGRRFSEAVVGLIKASNPELGG